MKIFQVNSVTVIKHSTNPLTLIIHAIGSVSSTGWNNPRLIGGGDTNPADKILDFSFEADAPTGISAPIVLPVSATLAVTPKDSVNAITVSARNNTITVHASEFVDGGAAANLGRAAALNFTSEFVGEENPRTSLWVGEEHLTTLAIGEEGSTILVGEGGHTTNPQLDDPPALKGGPFGGA